ncbi:MAG: hypothetical protein LBH41_02735, partial [Rickettsiales bacterium]|nr:hypothetical protein [Rickettsiales bacterium]
MNKLPILALAALLPFDAMANASFSDTLKHAYGNESYAAEIESTVRYFCTQLAGKADEIKADARLSEQTKSYFAKIKEGGKETCDGAPLKTILAMVILSFDGFQNDMAKAEAITVQAEMGDDSDGSDGSSGIVERRVNPDGSVTTQS